MERKIRINFGNKIEPYMFDYDIDTDVITMMIDYDELECKTFNKLIEENEDIKQALKDYETMLDLSKKEAENKKKLRKISKASIDNYKEFINNVDTVEFTSFETMNFDKIKDFISKNEQELEKYKIIIPEVDELDEFFKEHNDTGRYLISFKDDSCVHNYNDYLKMKNDFETCIENIKSLKLSNLESIILVSDLIKEKTYKEEKGDSNESRGIWNILYDSDNIVCAGYANLFEAILNKLEIPSSRISLSYGIGVHGHAYSQTYLVDDKYKIDGLFFTDLTRDSKLDMETIEYLYRYTYLLKPYSFFRKEDKNATIRQYEFFKENGIVDFNATEILEYIKETNETNNSSALKALKNLLLTVCYDYENIPDKNKEIIKLAKENREKIDRVTNQEINLSTFIKALAEVRYIENYCDPEKYIFSLKHIFLNAENYNFKRCSRNLTQEERLLEAIFGKSKEDSLETLSKELKEKYEKDPPKVKKVDLTLYRYKK